MRNGKTIALSGIRATGTLHFGNYWGAIRQFVELSRNSDILGLYFIANLHSLTTENNPEELRTDLHNIVLDYLSAGLNPDEDIIYAQSSVPELTELNWILACFTPFSELQRMPHFKDKSIQLQGKGDFINAGLFTYPVLMAADILGPLANIVPVGEDQLPHIELARDIARRFNNFCIDKGHESIFPIPESRVQGERVPGLSASGKMSKSEPDGCIFLNDLPAEIDRKLKKAATDPARIRRVDPGNPDNCNIGAIHQLISTSDEILWVRNGCQQATIGCIECKQAVATHIKQMLEPLQDKRQEFVAKGPSFVTEILHEGGIKARRMIAETVNQVKEVVGVPTY